MRTTFPTVQGGQDARWSFHHLPDAPARAGACATRSRHSGGWVYFVGEFAQKALCGICRNQINNHKLLCSRHPVERTVNWENLGISLSYCKCNLRFSPFPGKPERREVRGQGRHSATRGHKFRAAHLLRDLPGARKTAREEPGPWKFAVAVLTRRSAASSRPRPCARAPGARWRRCACCEPRLLRGRRAAGAFQPGFHGDWTRPASSAALPRPPGAALAARRRRRSPGEGRVQVTLGPRRLGGGARPGVPPRAEPRTPRCPFLFILTRGVLACRSRACLVRKGLQDRRGSLSAWEA